MDEEETEKKVAVLGTGNVAYSVQDLQTVELEELKHLVEELERFGATHVALDSGNFRGPKFLALTGEFEWLEEED